MQTIHTTTLGRTLTFMAALLVLKVTATVVLGYRDYIPPNFESAFLQDRERYFFGAYQWAFYVHLVAGPLSLILGTILVSDKFRARFPAWHRLLGRMQIANVLLLITPSGLWMSRYAVTGTVAGAGLAGLAFATATCATFGWRSALQRRFAIHRSWMWRTYLLLCSAVVIRLIGGWATVIDFDAEWLYPLSAWISWLAPLLIYELANLRTGPVRSPVGAKEPALHENAV